METIIIPSTNQKAIDFLNKIIANKTALMAITEAKIAERRAKIKLEKLMVYNA